MTDTAAAIIAHQHPAMRRLLRSAIEAEGATVLESGSLVECLHQLANRRGRALVLDPRLVAEAGQRQSLRALLITTSIPAVLFGLGPEQRGAARALGDLPFFYRLDDLDVVVRWVCGSLASAATLCRW
ncbi:MAG: hypothetical protein U0531_21890 [Dehalococcoidia bacterium]